MRYYLNLDTLPLYNWSRLQESITSGKTDFRWLIIQDINNPLPECTPEVILILANHYKLLMDEYPGINIPLLRSFVFYHLHYLKFKIQYEKNQIRILQDKSPKRLKQNKLNKVFGDYLVELNDQFESFNVKQFSIIKNYKERWLEIYKVECPNEIKDFDKIKFHVIEEFQEYVKDFEFKSIYLSSVYRNQFIQEKDIEVNNIKELDDYLLDFFIGIKEYKKYQLMRYGLFYFYGISGTQKTFKGDNKSIHDEIFDLAGFTNVSLNVHKNSVSDLVALRNTAKKKIEALTRKDKI